MRNLIGLAPAMLLLFAGAASGQVGPFVQEGKLLPLDYSSTKLGYAVAVSGDTAVIGSETAEVAYVFVRSGSTWTQQAKLTASDAGPSNDDQFGSAVAVSGDVIVVGAPNDSLETPPWNKSSAGSVYVFVRSGTTWVESFKISGQNSNDFFGFAVAMSLDKLAVGVPQGHKVGDIGTAKVFTWDGSTYHLEATLSASGGQIGGAGLAISGDTIVAGDSGSSTTPNVAYVFESVGSIWTQTASLSPPSASNWFGNSVAVSASSIVVGDYFLQGFAAAYVFEKTGDQWDLQSTLSPSVVPVVEGGAVVAVSGDRALVGWRWANDGATFLFLRSGNNWTQWGEVAATDGYVGDQFGRAVAMDSEHFIVGAPGLAGSGTAYVFRNLEIGEWTDAGPGMSGTAGLPTLTATGYLQPESPIALALAHAKPFSLAPLVVGLSAIHVPFKGGTLVPAPDFIFPMFSDFFGNAVFGGLWPPGVPSGLATYFQWWVQDPGGPKGYAASNALAGTTP